MDLSYMKIYDNQAYCAFCGKILIPIGLNYLCENYDREFLNYKRCECEMAVDYWNKKDSTNEQMKKRKSQIELMKKCNLQGIKTRFQECSFEDYQLREVENCNIEKIKKYLNETDSIRLIIQGDTNTGKTYFAACIANKSTKNGQIVVMNRLNLLFEKIKETYTNNGVSEDEMMDLYSNVDLLIIDDFGMERLTQWALEKFYTILSNRIENNLSTIITTKFKMSDLINRLNYSCDYEMVNAIVSKLKMNFYGISLDKKEKVSTSRETKC